MDAKDYVTAERWFREAVAFKSNFRSALFNLALLLSENKRPLEAVPILKQLLSHYPDHLKGMILLGDIYVNHERNLNEAEAVYNKILAINPKHIQGWHNLCVVYVEKGDLEKAEECLAAVHREAPGENYIAKHLSIVRGRLASVAPKQQSN